MFLFIGICMLRLDFETFALEGVTAFDDTGVCIDSFEVTTVSIS